MKRQRNRGRWIALLMCGVWLLSGAALAAEKEISEKGEPTHEFLEGVEIAPGVFEYRSEDGETVVISEPWEPSLKPGPISVAPWHGEIVMDGSPVSVWGENGTLADPVAYNGSIYVPLATVELWLGTEMKWEPIFKVVRLSLDQETVSYPQRTVPEGADLAEAKAQFVPAEEGKTIEAMFRPDAFLALNGEDVVEFANAQGEAVHIILVDDSVYLPVRGVSEFCGKTVSWEQNAAGEYFVSVK